MDDNEFKTPFARNLNGLLVNIKNSSDTSAVIADAMRAISLWDAGLYASMQKLPPDVQQQIALQFASAVRSGSEMKALEVAKAAVDGAKPSAPAEEKPATEAAQGSRLSNAAKAAATAGGGGASGGGYDRTTGFSDAREVGPEDMAKAGLGLMGLADSRVAQIASPVGSYGAGLIGGMLADRAIDGFSLAGQNVANASNMPGMGSVSRSNGTVATYSSPATIAKADADTFGGSFGDSRNGGFSNEGGSGSWSTNSDGSSTISTDTGNSYSEASPSDGGGGDTGGGSESSQGRDSDSSNSQGGTNDGMGPGGVGGWAKGGRVTKDRLSGPDPAGPDDGYGALDHGEFVIKASVAKKLGVEALKALNEGRARIVMN